jgi:hypothetical protein
MVSQVHLLDKDLRRMLQENKFGPKFTIKKQEIHRLQKELYRIHREKAQQQQQVPVGSIYSQFGPSFPSPTFSNYIFPNLIGEPSPLMLSNISSPVQGTQSLMFFEKYNLEIQMQN